ncbi:hypothetical protein FRACYDRAFT_258288 [Fragilariopsis cylindrus CCMP1102]|uniref:Uncharacterized protein n=1 Tax=Fragilariopsis cylindrus CCMP1102 TaxID=635003 RepID=A0A1E7EIR4_9STRA|nr:hypothetical protein FRACYDRAFT_258288 [Fragilariopsis cylindrus CCMP1102]|eukprot:OEU05782.1 hypothetical protein FRACYDRAFT_258288 [Fragilariopsis cylindrus CCMP1102]
MIPVNATTRKRIVGEPVQTSGDTFAFVTTIVVGLIHTSTALDYFLLAMLRFYAIKKRGQRFQRREVISVTVTAADVYAVGKKEKVASIVARCGIEPKHETHRHIAYRLATTTRTHTEYSQELLNFNNTITTKQRPTSIYPSLATNNEDKKPVHPLCSSSSIINSNAITPLYKDLPFETNLRALYGLEKTKRWYMRYGLLLFLR